MEILDDRFLFVFHFHFDVHECISGEYQSLPLISLLEILCAGELTKIMQKDDLSYKTLMDTIDEKKKILMSWTKKDLNGFYPWGPSLAKYLSSTNTENSFGAFKILSETHRDDLAAECSLHVERLLREIDHRFPESELHRCLSFLFNPVMLEENRSRLNDATFGREELNYLCEKYEQLPNFDPNHVQTEWELLKFIVISFMPIRSNNSSSAVFWKNLIELKQTTHPHFHGQYKNILMLLSVYLISPLNSAECERGYSVANRIQTTTRSRITIETLDCLLRVRLLLNYDIRR